jgi:hypothetical protein
MRVVQFFKRAIARWRRGESAPSTEPLAATTAPVAPPPAFSASTRADTHYVRPVAETESLRRPTHDDDFLLSNAASRWVFSLAPEDRPEWTVLHFPRVVNRIARCWSDPELLEALFEELLVDRRGGRAGFPLQIQAELIRLHALAGLPTRLLPQARPVLEVDIAL